MASSWSTSWGKAWGNSWGTVELEIEEDRVRAGGGSTKKYYDAIYPPTRKKVFDILADDNEVVLLIKMFTEVL